MVRRVTILLEKEVEKKLRLLQANKIQKTSNSVSFSQIINEQLRKNLKKIISQFI